MMDDVSELRIVGEYDRTPAELTIAIADPDDPHTAKVSVGITTGRFAGVYVFWILWSDIQGMARQLDRLHRSLEGAATMGECDGSLSFRVVDRGLGTVSIAGAFGDWGEETRHGKPRMRLEFEGIRIDQSYLPSISRALFTAYEMWLERH